ncbi:MAG: ATP-binding protein [Eubacteriaceae bacterium]
MKRDIIVIDEKKCNGCGLCIDACHEGALKLIDGKAKLISESYCDGLGDCLPECPTGAITIEKRNVAKYDEEAVNLNLAKKKQDSSICSCPSTNSINIKTNPSSIKNENTQIESQLNQWPCQIKLVPAGAPFLNNADLLIAADCTAYAYSNIHNDFMKNKITIIGCPKLDSIDYSQKFTDILLNNDIKSITILKMEVPCCGGIVTAIKQAFINSKKMIPWNVITISTDGRIIE